MKTITIGIIVAMAIISIAASPFRETGIVPGSEKKISKQTFGTFSFFRIHRQGRGATATWGMNSEAGVICYTLQRTYFDPNDPFSPWDDVCVLPCTGARSYKFTEVNVLTGLITYRVKATNTSSGETYSEMETIRIHGH